MDGGLLRSSVQGRAEAWTGNCVVPRCSQDGVLDGRQLKPPNTNRALFPGRGIPSSDANTRHRPSCTRQGVGDRDARRVGQHTEISPRFSLPKIFFSAMDKKEKKKVGAKSTRRSTEERKGESAEHD